MAYLQIEINFILRLLNQPLIRRTANFFPNPIFKNRRFRNPRFAIKINSAEFRENRTAVRTRRRHRRLSINSELSGDEATLGLQKRDFTLQRSDDSVASTDEILGATVGLEDHTLGGVESLRRIQIA